MFKFSRTAVLLQWTFWLLAVDAERWYSASLLEDNTHPMDELHFQFGNLYTPIAVYNNQSERNQPIPIDNIINDQMIPIDTLAKNKTSPKPVFKYFNNTINNVNVIKTVRPKRKFVRKRCPPIRQRQKKHFKGQKSKKFLEVFEVIEFDHVACTASSGLEGTCLPEQHCVTSGGTAMGSCADGYGSCCVTQFTCDGVSSAASAWFVNPGFPDPSTDRLACSLSIEKASGDIQQLRLDFFTFELMPPTAGTCEQDQFVVSGQNTNSIVPILCGVNTGQHVYVEVDETDSQVMLSVQTVSAENRLFAIKITQLSPSAELAAPRGCLQYFKDTKGYIESFNYRDKSDIAIARYPSYTNNLNYAMCIRRSAQSCSVTYSNDGSLQIVNYDSDGLPVLPPGQAGVEIFNCPTDWLLISAVRICGDRLNDGSVLQDFALDAPITDVSAGPIIVWFRSDGGYVGRGFRLQYQQNSC